MTSRGSDISDSEAVLPPEMLEVARKVLANLMDNFDIISMHQEVDLTTDEEFRPVPTDEGTLTIRWRKKPGDNQ